MTNKSKTIFCDLDGTLVKHNEPAEIKDLKIKFSQFKSKWIQVL